MRERAPEHQPDAAYAVDETHEVSEVDEVSEAPGPPGTAPAHEVTTRERGSFSSALCACGWRGPARRARDRARADAEEHLRTGAAG